MSVGAPVRLEFIREALASSLSESSRLWLETSGGVFSAGADTEACYQRFAEASSCVGTSQIGAARELGRRSRAGAVPGPIDTWTMDEGARVLLLVQAASHLSVNRLTELVEGCYFQGETRERQGVVRSLGFLPSGDRLLQIGLDAARTHVQPLFEALACENAFPVETFPDSAFNHLVLKALFTEVRLPRIIGLASRVTPELQRMVRDYVDERRAAGQAIPLDVALIISE